MRLRAARDLRARSSSRKATPVPLTGPSNSSCGGRGCGSAAPARSTGSSSSPRGRRRVARSSASVCSDVRLEHVDDLVDQPLRRMLRDGEAASPGRAPRRRVARPRSGVTRRARIPRTRTRSRRRARRAAAATASGVVMPQILMNMRYAPTATEAAGTERAARPAASMSRTSACGSGAFISALPTSAKS